MAQYAPKTWVTGEIITDVELNAIEQAAAAAIPKTDADAAYDAKGAATAAQASAVQRANHTGTQAATTITGLATVATSGAYTDLSGTPTLGTAATQPTSAFDAAGAATSAQAAALAGSTPLQRVAAVATTAGALAVNKHNPVDATAGPLTMTAPTGQAEGTQIVVEKTDATANAVTVSGNLRGSAGTVALVWQRETVMLRADSAGSWWPIAGHKTKAALDAAYMPSSGNTSVSGTKTFTGTIQVGSSASPPQAIEYPGGFPTTFQLRDNVYVGRRLGVGTEAPPRIPFAVSQVMDGSTLTSQGPANKVGAQLNITFQGGFSNEATLGAPDPGFLFGANDFILTGATAGDLAGITNLWGRLSETHLKTPGASITNMYALTGQANIDSTATGASVTGWSASIVATGPVNNAGATVANAASLYLTSATAGTAANLYNIYASGTAANFFGGQITANSGLLVSGTSGTTRFNGTTPNAQGSAAGVHVGTNSGSPGIELADGTNTVRLDTSSGTFRVLKAGVQSNFEIDLSGNTKMKGGPGFYNTIPVAAKPTVSGSRAGNAALASLLTTLASFGLLTDGTTA